MPPIIKAKSMNNYHSQLINFKLQEVSNLDIDKNQLDIFYYMTRNYIYLINKIASLDFEDFNIETADYILPFPNFRFYTKFIYGGQINILLKEVLEKREKSKTQIITTYNIYNRYFNKISNKKRIFKLFNNFKESSGLLSTRSDNQIPILENEQSLQSLNNDEKKFYLKDYYWIITNSKFQQHCRVSNKTNILFECHVNTFPHISIYIYAIFYHRVFIFIKRWNQILSKPLIEPTTLNKLLINCMELSNELKINNSLLFRNFMEGMITNLSDKKDMDVIFKICKDDENSLKIILDILEKSIYQYKEIIPPFDIEYHTYTTKKTSKMVNIKSTLNNYSQKQI